MPQLKIYHSKIKYRLAARYCFGGDYHLWIYHLLIHDLHDIFSGPNTDPLELDDNKNITSLSWADYLVLFSESKKGLQECLNRLTKYC